MPGDGEIGWQELAGFLGEEYDAEDEARHAAAQAAANGSAVEPEPEPLPAGEPALRISFGGPGGGFVFQQIDSADVRRLPPRRRAPRGAGSGESDQNSLEFLSSQGLLEMPSKEARCLPPPSSPAPSRPRW